MGPTALRGIRATGDTLSNVESQVFTPYKFGSTAGDRTPDLLTTRPTCYHSAMLCFIFTEVPVTIQRMPHTGSFGTVRVDFSTLHPWESYPYLPGGSRAGPADYSNSSGSVVMGPGITEATFNVTVRDDIEPEVDETFFVRLIGAFLIQGEQARIGEIYNDSSQS